MNLKGYKHTKSSNTDLHKVHNELKVIETHKTHTKSSNTDLHKVHN